MRWDAIRGDEIRVKQQKGGRELDIPLHPELAAILSKAPRVATTIITTQRGKPFSPGGVTLGHAMRAWCDAVALPHCSAHGLRKASATRLAEAGCPAHEIMSITGHETLSEVDRYTKAASQKRLARAAMLRIVNKGER
ncbi:MAG: tyrosine-type recombinase/integrase, partial [Pseudomonadota bacterium]